MKSTITEKKRKILRTIFGALSFSTALFVFQACYGTPEDFGQDVVIQGSVQSKETKKPIPGIKVSIENQFQYEVTDDEGNFKMYTSRDSVYHLRFEDIDSTRNGVYLPKDTIVKGLNGSTFITVSLDAN